MPLLNKILGHHVNTITNTMAVHFNAMNNRLDKMESRLDMVETRVKELAEKVPSTMDPGQCRYNTEERSDMLAEIDHRMDESLIDLKTECYDSIEGVEKEASEAEARLARRIEKKMQQSCELLTDMIHETVADKMNETLQSASLQINGTISLKM